MSLREALRPIVLATLLATLSGCSGNSDPQLVVPTQDRKFEVGKTVVSFPSACAPASVVRRIMDVVGAFNRGDTATALRAFPESGSLNAYGLEASEKPFLVGHGEISSWFTQRHDDGDGWTLMFIWPPKTPTGLPSRTTYSFGVRVSRGGELIFEGGARAVLDCRTGLIMEWLGPGVGAD